MSGIAGIFDPTGAALQERVIVFDGRLDNRDEIRHELGIAGIETNRTTDAHLVLAAYRCWGRDCAHRLIGDFAFAIWDERNTGLFCVRDALGVKPFYYFHSPELFVFGSEVCQVVQNPAVPHRANECFLAEILSGEVRHLEETIYRDIRRLPPAHWLWVDRDGVQIQRYWSLQPGSRIRHRSRAEYEEHFRDVFRQAVQSRLPETGTPGLRLSGGRDSPPIAGAAQELLDKEGQGRRLQAYSLFFPDSPCDESREVGQVVDFTGIRHFSHAFEGFPDPPDWSKEVKRTRDLPFYPTMTAMDFLFRQAAERDVRVSFTGLGAHRTMGGTSCPWLSYLRDFRLGELGRQWWWQARDSGVRPAARSLTASMVWPVLPSVLKRHLSNRRVSVPHNGFMTPEFVEQSGLAERVATPAGRDVFSDLAQWAFANRLYSGDHVYNHEMQNRHTTSRGIEDRHPFLDRRLVEFAFAIPDWLHHDRHRWKPLLLDASRPWVPRTVRHEPGYGELSCLYLAAMRLPAFRDTMEDAEIARLGWVDGANVRRSYRELLAGSEPGAGVALDNVQTMYGLWWVFAVETWLRTL